MPSSTTSRSRSSPCAKSWRADGRRAAALLVVAAAPLACTTAWHSRLAEDRFQISYRQRADLCALLYSAELTLAAGYRRFYAVQGFSPRITTVYTPGPATTNIVSDGKVKTVTCAPGLPGCTGGTSSSSETPSTYEIHLLHDVPDTDATWRILRRNGLRPADLFVYDASRVRDSLGADLGDDCTLDPPPSRGPVLPPETRAGARDGPMAALAEE